MNITDILNELVIAKEAIITEETEDLFNAELDIIYDLGELSNEIE